MFTLSQTPIRVERTKRAGEYSGVLRGSLVEHFGQYFRSSGVSSVVSTQGWLEGGNTAMPNVEVIYPKRSRVMNYVC